MNKQVKLHAGVRTKVELSIINPTERLIRVLMSPVVPDVAAGAEQMEPQSISSVNSTVSSARVRRLAAPCKASFKRFRCRSFGGVLFACFRRRFRYFYPGSLTKTTSIPQFA